MNKITLSLIAMFAIATLGCAHKHGEKKCCHGKKAHHKVEKMFDKMDTDKDGSISKKEFDAKHGNMFGTMDSNKDGKISKEEALAHKKSHHDHKGHKHDGKKECCK